MARANYQGELSDGKHSLAFSIAGETDDEGLRRLLRETPMRGSIRLSFSREPHYFKSEALAATKSRTIIAREKGRLVASGHFVTRRCWLNGAVGDCTYLGELRVDASARERRGILRRGYAFADQAQLFSSFCFTSILSDNTRARRLFERGLPWLPRYLPIGEYVSVLVPAKGARVVKDFAYVSGLDVGGEAILDLLNGHARMRNLTLQWTSELLVSLAEFGMGLGDMTVLIEKGTPIGCFGVWDQRAFRQLRVDSYAPWLAASRPIINLLGSRFGFPRLPSAGSELSLAYLTPLAFSHGREEVLPFMIEAARRVAAARGIDQVVWAYANEETSCATLFKRLSGLRFSSRLYQVVWQGRENFAMKLGSLPSLPDIALL